MFQIIIPRKTYNFCYFTDQLKTIFERFGTIVDLRVYNKSTANPTGSVTIPGRSLPNYAFLTFDDPQSAQSCLNAAVSGKL